MTAKKQTDKQALDVPSANRRDFKLSETLNNRWRIRLPLSVTPEQCRDSDYLSSVLAVGSNQLRPFDELMLVGGGGKWVAQVMVADAGLGWCSTVFLFEVFFPESRAQHANRVPAGFAILLDRESGEFSAVRTADDHPFVEGAKTHEDALRQLLDKASVRDTVKGARA